MTTKQIFEQAAKNAALLIAIALAVYIFINYTIATDQLYLLFFLPALCAIPPTLSKLYPIECINNYGIFSGTVRVAGKVISKSLVMLSIIYGGTVAIIGGAGAVAITTCHFSGGPACMAII